MSIYNFVRHISVIFPTRKEGDAHSNWQDLVHHARTGFEHLRYIPAFQFIISTRLNTWHSFSMPENIISCDGENQESHTNNEKPHDLL
jgi:hypothetical protein